MSETHLIVGGGLAAGKAAEAMREEGFDGRIVLVTAEGERPYERPPLSKEYLRGEAGREKIYVHEESWYAEHDVELRVGEKVTALDAAGSVATLGSGEELRFDRALLATGAEPRRLNVPGADLDGVHLLRSVDDSDALRERLEAGGKLVVVGGGWIGCEVAASARQRGLAVTLVEPLELPLLRVLGPEIGRVFYDVHRDHGVEMLTGTGLESFVGDGSLRAVRTSDGREIEADFAVVGVGVVPRTQLAESAGLDVGDGIEVHANLRTSVPTIFAAGDVASQRHPRYDERVRVEHWANALNQGAAAGRAMAGADVAYDRIPYFFSDQYDVGMEYSGLPGPDDELVVRGELGSAGFVAFWWYGGRVTAGLNLNVWDVTEPIGELIRSRTIVEREALADPDTPLESLVGSAAG
jgi:3-phenylpropionate/trans-cinnamate dioxygenase ferredoxin reductase component